MRVFMGYQTLLQIAIMAVVLNVATGVARIPVAYFV